MTIDDRVLDGTVEFRLSPGPSVAWQVKGWNRPGLGPVEITFPPASCTVRAEAVCSSRGLDGAGGTIPCAEIGPRDLSMNKVIVHWLNLPPLCASEVIYNASARSTYLGRWTAFAGGWRVTVDQRADHGDVWRRARDDGAFVMTHVMEVRRDDGSVFTANDIDPVIDALQLGLSFALGRAVAPALPVGFDAAGRRVWEQWAPRHCTAGEPGALRWWPEDREQDLARLLDLVIRRYRGPEERFSVRFLLTSAVLSAAGGFVEQRIMTGFAALEHLSWIRLVTIGGMSNSDYKDKQVTGDAAGRLAMVLDEASIPKSIDGRAQPTLDAPDRWLPVDVTRTGPDITTWVRNKIVHPTGHEGRIYREEGGVLRESWLLTHYYLVLLILHHLGFDGRYHPLLSAGGWATDAVPVPWASGRTTPLDA